MFLFLLSGKLCLVHNEHVEFKDYNYGRPFVTKHIKNTRKSTVR